MKADLDTLIRRLADLSRQSVPNVRRWVMHEANQAHIRPITFCQKRLKEIATYSVHKLVVEARTKHTSPHNPYHQHRAARAMKYALKHHCTLDEAYFALQKDD